MKPLLTAALLCALSINSHAAFEARDSQFGANTLVYDTDTGLEWLRLDQTYGLSYNDVYSQMGTTFAGFRIAGDEVAALVRTIGIPWWEFVLADTVQPQSLLDEAQAFLTIFGGVAQRGYDLGLRGFTYAGGIATYTEDGIVGNMSVEPMAIGWTPEHVTYYDDNWLFKTNVYANTGTFLISTTPVPEPATSALMVLGLSALWLLRRRHDVSCP